MFLFKRTEFVGVLYCSCLHLDRALHSTRLLNSALFFFPSFSLIEWKRGKPLKRFSLYSTLVAHWCFNILERDWMKWPAAKELVWSDHTVFILCLSFSIPALAWSGPLFVLPTVDKEEEGGGRRYRFRSLYNNRRALHCTAGFTLFWKF